MIILFDRKANSRCSAKAPQRGRYVKEDETDFARSERSVQSAFKSSTRVDLIKARPGKARRWRRPRCAWQSRLRFKARDRRLLLELLLPHRCAVLLLSLPLLYFKDFRPLGSAIVEVINIFFENYLLLGIAGAASRQQEQTEHRRHASRLHRLTEQPGEAPPKTVVNQQ